MLTCASTAQAKVTPKIVNGSDASISDFPFQVAVYDPSEGATPDETQYCGGVVLDTTHVITAAHCLYDVFTSNHVSSATRVAVLAGTADLSASASPAARRNAETVSFDPLYDPATNDHDVGLITLPAGDPLPTEPEIASVPFISTASLGTVLSGHSTLTVTGWGDTSAEPVEGGGSPSFPLTLKKADVPAVDQPTCVSDYSLTTPPTPITDRMFCAGDGPAPVKDSCQGDSGGPIVFDSDAGAGVSYVLAGLVDSGAGCAQSKFPGIYTRMDADGPGVAFASSTPPQAPLQSTATTLTGGDQPGQTLTCAPGTWTPATPDFSFQIFKQGSVAPVVVANGPTYTIQEGDRNARLFCQAKAANAGGYGFATSNTVLVPAAVPPPPPPPPATDSVAPRLKVLKKTCTRTSCSVTVHVTDASPSSGLGKLRAMLRWKQKVSCRSSKKGGAARTCTKRRSRTLHPKAGKNGSFTVTATRLPSGTSFSLSLVPFDKAGNRPQFSTITNVRTKAPRRHRL